MNNKVAKAIWRRTTRLHGGDRRMYKTLKKEWRDLSPDEKNYYRRFEASHRFQDESFTPQD